MSIWIISYKWNHAVSGLWLASFSWHHVFKIHTLLCGSAPQPLWSDFLLCGHITFCFSVIRLLCISFCFLAIMKNAAINICAHMLYAYISLGFILRSRIVVVIWQLYISLCEKCQISKVAMPLLSVKQEDFYISLSCQHLAYYGFDLCFPNEITFNIFSVVFIGCVCIFFGGGSCKSLVHFKIGFCLFIVVLHSFLYILDSNPLPDV